MDNETRHLDAGDAARLPGSAPAPVPPAAPGHDPGTPTGYLPPVGAAPGATSAPPTPNAGTTYAVPGSQATAGGREPGYRPMGPGAQPLWSRSGRPAANWIPLVLIALGLWALFGSARHVFGAAIPLALGLIFLYVSTQGPHRWGFRIPGALLTGLGAGIVFDALSIGGGGYSAVGLGLGFVALWFWDRAQWWWLIPGAIIGLGGLQGVLSNSAWTGNWLFPLALIALGAYLLRGRQWRTRRP